MGRWFPGMRKGTPEQVRAFDRAQREQIVNAEREHVAGVRDETERYHELNHRTNETMRPLSGFQRSMFAHDMRTTAAEFRAKRMAAAERRERKAAADPREAREKAQAPSWSRYRRWEAKEQGWLDRQRGRARRRQARAVAAGRPDERPSREVPPQRPARGRRHR